MDKRKMKKLLILNLPYFLVGLFATNLGEAWRLAEGADSSAKILSFFHALPIALNNPFPSFHPLDLLIGILCGAGLRLAVYLKGKNAKKYRHNVEYGSARWGTAKDIEPFIAPKFEDNVILTKTERLMMSNRPKNPANARNKNVLIIGGSGSGKTRFWLKPNLLQMHSSYVVTDPKGSIVIECGNALLKHGYTIKIFNTINFQKSMHYNPFAYIHSEKDILKLVTTLIANTKGDGKAGHILISRLMEESAPAALLFEILHPLGFNSVQAGDVFRSLSAQSGKRFVSAGWEVLRDRTELIIRRRKLADEEVEENVPPFRLAMETQEIMPDFVIPKNKDTACLDADKVVLPLTVRKWRQGDKFVPFGMKGKKKISDYLTDRKFSLFQKENQYVVCSAGQIVWLVGERSDDRFRVTEDTKRVLIIQQLWDK